MGNHTSGYGRYKPETARMTFRGSRGFPQKARRENSDYDRLTGGRKVIDTRLKALALVCHTSRYNEAAITIAEDLMPNWDLSKARIVTKDWVRKSMIYVIQDADQLREIEAFNPDRTSSRSSFGLLDPRYREDG